MSDLKNIEDKITALKAVVENAQKPPVFVSGTWSVPKDALRLFYSDQNAVQAIQFPAGEEECKALAAACQAATFGRNNEDVLDESYRKAGKMDRSQFAMALDGSAAVSLEKAAKELLTVTTDQLAEDIDVELYKLNVYGPGSFFKSHKDTPRSVNMFGSVVIILPTQFRGGELVLRHDGKEHKHDAAHALNSEADPDSAIASWITFFSDVEHEVLPVTEGYRVTLTYNLYRSTSPTEAAEVTLEGDDLKPAIQKALRDPAFFPQGGLLGFGLSHAYPVDKGTNIREVKLKGSDAILMNAFGAIGIRAEVRALYSSDADDDEYSMKGEVKWLTSKFIELDAQYEPVDDCFERASKRARAQRAICVDRVQDLDASRTGFEEPVPVLLWVTRPSEKSRVEHNYIAYGNEAQLVTDYADLNLVFTIPPVEGRKELVL